MHAADLDAVALAVLAVLLAGPVPARLARARWPARDPRTALVAWQAVGLAGGLAAIGSLLSVGIAPGGRHLVHGLIALPGRGFGSTPLWRVVVFGAGVVLAGWLLAVSARSFASVLRERRRHRQIVDLVGRPEPRSGTVVLEHAVAVAYCVPGVRPRVVLSEAALELLADDELTAVLAHERAHARGRHDLVVQPFIAWQSTFPFLRPAFAATRAVALLVEMLADDAASRRTEPATVAAALARLGAGRLPVGALGAAAEASALATRVRRLLEPPAALPPAAVLLVHLAALALVAVPTAVVCW
ncbi:MAG TPA: M56 family metallopeptidase [Mycobacteriales bacterium]|jgi:Zn-dependent protease with chaperone function|nr:M56 family metallopeptidase [Mycobacteriales bacterium]